MDQPGLELEDEDISEVGLDGRPIWDDESEDIFITLMEEEVHKGNRNTYTFSTVGWKNLKIGMNKRTGKIYTKGQLKNMFNKMRTHYGVFKQMLFEIVWYNSVTGEVQRKEERWERLLKVMKNCKQYQRRGCFHYYELRTIFDDTLATRAHAHPSTRSRSLSRVREDPKDVEFVLGTEKQVESRQRSRSPKGCRRGKRKKFTSSIDRVVSSINRSADRKGALVHEALFGKSSTCEASCDESNSPALDKDRTTLKECMNILNSMEGIDGASYSKAARMFCADAAWREVFLDMPENRQRDVIFHIFC